MRERSASIFQPPLKKAFNVPRVFPRRQIAQSSVQVISKILGSPVSDGWNLSLNRSPCKCCCEGVRHFTTKDSPWNFDSPSFLNRGTRFGWLSERHAEGPTTQGVPVLDPGVSLQFYQLIASLLIYSYSLNWRLHS